MIYWETQLQIGATDLTLRVYRTQVITLSEPSLWKQPMTYICSLCCSQSPLLSLPSEFSKDHCSLLGPLQTPVVHVLLNSPRIQGPSIIFLLNSPNLSLRSSLHLPLPLTWPKPNITTSGSRQQQLSARPEFTPDPHPHSILLKVILFLNTCLPLIPSYLAPTQFCVFWPRQHFFTPLQILRCKTRRRKSLGPLPCHDFLFSLQEINGPCCSHPEAVFIGALWFSVSLLGPVVPRSHVRTDYTPAKHCSVPHWGFALSGRALIIIVQETSNVSPIAFDAVKCIVMPSTLWASETQGVSL